MSKTPSGEVRAGEKWCHRCERSRPPQKFSKNARNADGLQTQCKDCWRDRYHANREDWKLASRRNYFARTYGITIEQYDAMVVAQGGKCALCEGPPDGKGKHLGRFHVDHDHITEKVRQLLCFKCNSSIGKLESQIDSGRLVKAIHYLVQWESLTQDEVRALSAALDS